jgi:hypothetical protein
MANNQADWPNWANPHLPDDPVEWADDVRATEEMTKQELASWLDNAQISCFCK